MRKFLTLVIILILISFAGFYFGAGTIAKSAIEKIASQTLDTKVEVSGVKISPFAGNISISGLKIHNPEGFGEGPAVEVGEIFVQTKESSPLAVLKNPLEIAIVNVDEMVIYLQTGLNGNNVFALQKNAQRYSSTISESEIAQENQKKVVIDALEINNPQLYVALKSAKPGVKGLGAPMGSIVVRNIGKDDQPANVAYMLSYILQRVLIKLPLLEGDVQGTMEGVKGVLDGAAESIKGVLGQ